MSPTGATSSSPPRGPAWEIATLFPDQGDWSEGDYLALETNRLVEFCDGCVQVLPMPKTSHQRMVQFLSNLLLAFVTPRRLGTVLFAPLRVRLRAGQYREPDVLFMLAGHADRIGEDFWHGADLVMEVVSDDNREHDLVRKRAEYAAAGIPEYWIIDPQDRRVTVLALRDGAYHVHAQAAPGQPAGSALLPGFELDPAAVFAAAEGPRP